MRVMLQHDPRRPVRAPATPPPSGAGSTSSSGDRLLETLLPVLAAYEIRYGVSSARMRRALASGHLAATEDVRDWMTTYDTCRSLVRGAHNLA